MTIENLVCTRETERPPGCRPTQIEWLCSIPESIGRFYKTALSAFVCLGVVTRSRQDTFAAIGMSAF